MCIRDRKKNENKVANLIGNKVAQQLEGIKDATSKSKTTKAHLGT